MLKFWFVVVAKAQHGWHEGAAYRLPQDLCLTTKRVGSKAQLEASGFTALLTHRVCENTHRRQGLGLPR